jgi:hypothetical protein
VIDESNNLSWSARTEAIPRRSSGGSEGSTVLAEIVQQLPEVGKAPTKKLHFKERNPLTWDPMGLAETSAAAEVCLTAAAN